MPSEQLLEVKELTVGREGVPLLAGLSFVLAPGEAFLLQGPNGAGKTTLLRTLAGFLAPLAGQLDAAELAFAGHLDGVKAQLTVAENLRFWAEIHGGASIEPALTSFDLIALQNRPARALSAGQKRRLGLARLVLTGRKLWLLDEPTVSLDRASVARFADVVRAHLAGGGAALIATHTDLGLDLPVLDIASYRLGAVSGQKRDGAPSSRPDPDPNQNAKKTPAASPAMVQESNPAHDAAARRDPFGAGW